MNTAFHYRGTESDALDTFGEPVPSEVHLFLSPTFKGAGHFRPVAPAPAPAPPTPGVNSIELTGIPQAAGTGAPLASRAVHDWLRSKIANAGPVEALPMTSPVLSAAFQKARADVAAVALPMNLGINSAADVAVIAARYLAEIAVRGWALPPTMAYELIRQHRATALATDADLREVVEAATAGGVTAPRCLATTMLAEAARAQMTKAEAAAQQAANVAALSEPVEVDLQAEDLCLIEGNGPRALYRLEGLPCGNLQNVQPTRQIGDDTFTPTGGRYSVQSTGKVTVTRAVREAVKPLSCDMQRDIITTRQLDIPPRQYVSSDFRGDPRTPEGRWALEDFRRRAEAMVTHTHAYETRSAFYAWITLVVAYGGAVSWQNAIQSLQVCVQKYAQQKAGRRTMYKPHTATSIGLGIAMPDEPVAIGPYNWPSLLIRPPAIESEMLKALRAGKATWSFGELLPRGMVATAASAVRRLAAGGLEAATAAYIATRPEVRLQDVLDHLCAEGLLPSATCSPTERDKITGAFKSAGLEQADRMVDGRHQRVWVRASEAAQ
jgi:hypothetical protein